MNLTSNGRAKMDLSSNSEAKTAKSSLRVVKYHLEHGDGGVAVPDRVPEVACRYV